MTATIKPKPGQTMQQARDAARKARYRVNIAAGRAPTDDGPVAAGEAPVKPKRKRRTKAQMAAARAKEARALLAQDQKEIKASLPAKPKYAPTEIADGVLHILYPQAVPLNQVRAVAQWVNLTDSLVSNAFQSA